MIPAGSHSATSTRIASVSTAAQRGPTLNRVRGSRKARLRATIGPIMATPAHISVPTRGLLRMLEALAVIAPAILIMSAPANGAELAGIVTGPNGEPLADAVVYAVALDPQPAPADNPRRAVIDQVNLQFTPFVTVVQTGAEIVFPNADNIGHNVYSVSRDMTFTLGLSRGVEAPPVVFITPGVVVMGCNIHDWMLAYVLVLETPNFGVTGANGTTVLRNLPPGPYEVRVWHPGMVDGQGDVSRQVEVRQGEIGNTSFSLALKPRCMWVIDQGPVGG